MISVRWRPSSWMQFSSLFFFNRPWHGPTTDDRMDEFPDGWLPSNRSTYGVCEHKHAISNTPKRKNHTLKDRDSEGATARLLTNASYTNTRCSTGQVSIATEVANTEQKNANHLVPHPPWPTYWVLPIQKSSGSRGTPCRNLVISICISIATEVANTEQKNADHLVPQPGHPTEYYPFKNVGLPWVTLYYNLSLLFLLYFLCSTMKVLHFWC